MINFDVTDEHLEVMYEMSITQYRTLRNIKVHNGHEMFKMNINDGVISKANCTILNKHISLKYEVGHLYIAALNLNNAHNKFDKILNQINIIAKRRAIANLMHILSLKGSGQINLNKS